MADHVGDDFTVGRRSKYVADRLKLFFQFGVIFDDAVVHDDDFAISAHMRMRVEIGRFAVRRPSRVTDAGRTVERVGGHKAVQFFDAAFSFANSDFAVVLNGDSRTVVSAIFKTPQALQQKFRSRTKSNVTDDTTHVERSIA